MRGQHNDGASCASPHRRETSQVIPSIWHLQLASVQNNVKPSAPRTLMWCRLMQQADFSMSYLEQITYVPITNEQGLEVANEDLHGQHILPPNHLYSECHTTCSRQLPDNQAPSHHNQEKKPNMGIGLTLTPYKHCSLHKHSETAYSHSSSHTSYTHDTPMYINAILTSNTFTQHTLHTYIHTLQKSIDWISLLMSPSM